MVAYLRVHEDLNTKIQCSHTYSALPAKNSALWTKTHQEGSCVDSEMTDKTRPQCEVLVVDVGLWNRTAMFPCNLTTLSEFKTLSPVSVHQNPMGTGIRCLILGNLAG